MVIFLTIISEEVPRIATEERIEMSPIGESLYRVTARYGFMQDPHVLAILARCHKEGLPIDREDTTVFLNREVPHLKQPASLWQWRRDCLPSSRGRRAARWSRRIRPEWVVELGTRVEI